MSEIFPQTTKNNYILTSDSSFISPQNETEKYQYKMGNNGFSDYERTGALRKNSPMDDEKKAMFDRSRLRRKK